jgi:TRAP-type C4-dicarboxylate transport system permease large subunit
MMQTQGISLLWFGVFLTILIEAAQITPPVGFNLFVLQSLSDRDIWKVNRATIPFFVLLMVVLVVISLEPGLVTWLPRRMMSSY